MKLRKSKCEKLGHDFSGTPQAIDNVPIGDGRHTTLAFIPCLRCCRAHQEFGGNSEMLGENGKERVREVFQRNDNEVFFSEE